MFLCVIECWDRNIYSNNYEEFLAFSLKGILLTVELHK